MVLGCVCACVWVDGFVLVWVGRLGGWMRMGGWVGEWVNRLMGRWIETLDVDAARNIRAISADVYGFVYLFVFFIRAYL